MAVVRVSDFENIPETLRERDQWLFWNGSNDTPRAPLDSPAASCPCSWSDPDVWMPFDEVAERSERTPKAGIGFVNAANNDDYPRGIIGSIDIDGVTEEPHGSPKDWLPSLRPFFEHGAYIEWSPSGHGLRIPIIGIEEPEWWSDQHFSDEEHEGVEVLTNKFSTYTGNQLNGSSDEIAEYGEWLDEWLREVYKSITGEDPVDGRQDEIADNVTDGSEPVDKEWLTADVAEDALDHINPDSSYSVWRDVGMALTNLFGSRGESMFESWSRGGSKWDSDAERQAQRIERDAGNYQYDAGTIIHYAKQGGWNASTAAREQLGGADEFTSAPPSSADAGEETEPDTETETDGGATAAEGGDTSGPEPEPSLDDSWEHIREMFREASDDDRATPRFEAAMKLHREEHFANLKENEVLYAYDDDRGIYDSDGEAVVREQLTVGLEEQYRSHTKNEVLEHIRGRNTLSKDDMGGPAWLIAAENCVIDLDAAEQRDHSPEYQFMSRLGTHFDPDADAPRFREFLRDAVPSESDRRKLQEFAGYALHHWGHPYHKALFLVGPTASGKSTFLDTINAMLGAETTASLTPQQMTSERFAGAELFEKWANIRNDIPKATVENTGAFKEIVAGDPMKAEEKYKDPFRFEPTAKHLFAANQLPETDVDDEAFYRRILLVPFPETVPVNERDKHLDDKLQEELPGVLNWAIQGLQRLREQAGFTGDRSPGHTADTWQKWGDSVSRFANDAVSETTGEHIPKSKLYAAYLEYCRQEGIPSDTQHTMTRGLKQESFEDGRQYIDGNRKRCFLNIDWTGRGRELLDAAKNRTSDDERDSDPGRGSALKDF